MACHLRQASGQGETALYAIRARGCVTPFTHGKVFHRQGMPTIGRPGVRCEQVENGAKAQIIGTQ
jgi:hypothetical protein